MTRSTMMVLTCLRFSTKFLDAYERATKGLPLTLPSARVDQLFAAGMASPIAPAGRRFRMWAMITPKAGNCWPEYLAEAQAFVAACA